MSHATNEVMIEIKNLKKAFGEHVVLKDISLQVNKGSVVAMIGPSGSGKSTLLRCINLDSQLQDSHALRADLVLQRNRLQETANELRASTERLRSELAMRDTQARAEHEGVRPCPAPQSIAATAATAGSEHGCCCECQRQTDFFPNADPHLMVVL